MIVTNLTTELSLMESTHTDAALRAKAAELKTALAAYTERKISMNVALYEKHKEIDPSKFKEDAGTSPVLSADDGRL